MMHPSQIQPDAELRDLLQGHVVVADIDGNAAPVVVYRDWERPTNMLPDDFIVVYVNGDMRGVGQKVHFAQGNLVVGLYCKMNDDGSVKVNRIRNILSQFDEMFSGIGSDNYYYEYDMPQFITPTTPNQSSGYSITMLNLRWHTNDNFVNNA